MDFGAPMTVTLLHDTPTINQSNYDIFQLSVYLGCLGERISA